MICFDRIPIKWLRPYLRFRYCFLEFICYLMFVICNFRLWLIVFIRENSCPFSAKW
ncbi:hypothetical protein D1AOALGA4SA_11800 [Olavius algarvensis Delta 1 endosymbiont]|nr:hypothetical protein D1AOALGA4SA_11800 [Olavius algarvensis Delta 1 endosymbiont]